MKEEKQFLLDEVVHQVNGHPAFLLASYQGLKANQLNGFRRQVEKLGGDVQMIKKRLLVKAIADCGIEVDVATLPGHISLISTGQDAVEVLKLVFEFSKDNSGAFSVLNGRIDGQIYNGNQIEQISKLPGRDEMRATLLATLEAPLSQTLAVMDALLCSVIHCMQNKNDKAENG